MRRGPRAVALAVALVLALHACSEGPAGPGTFTLAVDAPVALGAVQLEVQGPGITAVRGLSSGRLVVRPVTDGEIPTWRAVIFEPGGTPIRLEIEVESTDAVIEGRVLDAAGTDGAVLSPAGIGVRVER